MSDKRPVRVMLDADQFRRLVAGQVVESDYRGQPVEVALEDIGFDRAHRILLQVWDEDRRERFPQLPPKPPYSDP